MCTFYSFLNDFLPEFTLVRGARQLVTLRGPDAPRRGSALNDMCVIEDGSVLIRNDRIFAVGSTRRIENMKEARNALEIPATGQVVMPGFVDVDMNVTEPHDGAVSDRSRTRRLQRLYEGTLALMRSCLQHGTLAADVSGHALGASYEEDLPVIRQLAKVGRAPVYMNRRWRVTRRPEHSEDESALLQTFEAMARRKLIDGVEVSSNFLANSDLWSGVAAQLFSTCARERLGVRLSWDGGSEAELRSQLATWKPENIRCSTSMPDAEVEVCARWSKMIIFSPGSDLRMPGGMAMRRLLDSGGAVALGSGYDSVRTPGFSMQMAVTLAVLNGQLSPEEAITAATVNAAHAAGCADDVGTLQVGKRADLLVLTVPDYREMARQFGINQVGMVFREGELVFNRSRWKIGAHGAAAGRMHS